MNKQHPLCRHLEELENVSSKAPAKAQSRPKPTEPSENTPLNRPEATQWTFDPSICG
ncbi:hypothetical protein [Thiolinea disciformis]|uniref:hypothetical protein n=1 Tax=Thiolinea disciformis TaxID=125614 RepID=UPI00038257AB|nr:hypothetical protein [Thiolinea disciformis]